MNDKVPVMAPECGALNSGVRQACRTQPKCSQMNTRRERTLTRFGPLLVVLAVGLLSSACASLPTNDNAVVQVEKTWTFPYFLVDFASVDLYIREVDGKCCLGSSIELTPGAHSLTVEAFKGPNGYLGVAPFAGNGTGKRTFTSELRCRTAQQTGRPDR